MKSPVEVEIFGRPAYNGRVLVSDDLKDVSDTKSLVRFARSLRGQYALIIRGQRKTMAVTDPLGSYPVYYGAGGVSASAHAISPDGRLNREAIFSYAALGKNVTQNSVFAGAARMPCGSVLAMDGTGVAAITSYFRIAELLELPEILPCEAREKFLELGGSYLRAVLGGEHSAACLFSSGIDSALIVMLMKQHCPSVPLEGWSVDYSRILGLRYSEYREAKRNANRLDLPLQKAVCRAKDFYTALDQLLNDRPDIPPCDRAMPIQYVSLLRAGTSRPAVYLTGFNADRPYCGHVHWGVMARKYSRAVNCNAPALTFDQKAAMLCFPQERRLRIMEGLVSMAGYSVEDYNKWIREYRTCCVDHVRELGDIDFLRLIMILSEEEIGDLWASEHLLLERHYGVKFISPFGDLDIVRLGFSLPLSYHYSSGGPKRFLRELLCEKTGLNLNKRAFPSPMRFWALRPQNLLLSHSRSARKYYASVWMRNLAVAGRIYSEAHDTLVLSRWLERQEMKSQ